MNAPASTFADASTADDPIQFEPVDVVARFENPRADIDRDTSRGWLTRLVPILLVNRWPFVIGITLTVVSMVSGVAVPAVTGKLIDAIGPAITDGTVAALYWLMLILGALGLVSFVASFFGRYLMSTVSNQLEADLRSIIYNHLVTLSFAFYDKIQTGQVISRANSDIRAIQMFLMMAPMMLTSVFSFVFAFAYMLTVNVSLTLAAMISMPVVYWLSMRLRRMIFPLSWLVQARTADVAVVVDENINGQRVVKSFAQEANQVNLLAVAAHKLQWAQIKSIDINAIYSPVIENLTAIGQVLVWVYGGYLVIEGELALGSLVAFNMYIMLVQMPFRFLGFLLQMEQRARASAGRIYEILDRTPDIVDSGSPTHLINPAGLIEFRDVHFAYDDEPVLKGATFTVEQGETVAVVGRTGSGKSTIVRLLSRFYEVDAGTIHIDGVDIRDLSTKSLHFHVGQVLDEPFLFSESVRKNIAYGRPDASIEEVMTAARAAQAHDFIMDMRDGYDTVVGERGYTLSGGQRQRIGIARSLLLNPPILVLDDATSAIDVNVEAAIHESLLRLMQDRTTMVIAHRMSTISLAQRVLLLEDGKIIATGTHQELMANEPRYADVLDQQVRAHQAEPVLENDDAQAAEETDAEYRARIASVTGSAPSPGGSGPDMGGR